MEENFTGEKEKYLKEKFYKELMANPDALTEEEILRQKSDGGAPVLFDEENSFDEDFYLYHKSDVKNVDKP